MEQQILRIYEKINKQNKTTNKFFITIIILLILNTIIFSVIIFYIYKQHQPETIVLPPGVTIEELEVL